MHFMYPLISAFQKPVFFRNGQVAGWRIVSACFANALMSIVCFTVGHTANLHVSGGQLVGASDVDVGGVLYNVEFRTGTCNDLYGGWALVHES
jgi:hypothetical protein